MSKVVVAPEGLHAFFFVDPGGTTGVAAAHIELRHTVKRTMQEGVRSRKAAEVKGSWYQQAVQLTEMITKFRFVAQVEHGIPTDRIHIGFENYTRRPSSKDNNLEPVEVRCATVGMLGWDPAKMKNLYFQEPSEAMGYATNDRLRLWNWWEVGSEHKRDAVRHLVYRVNRVLG